MRTEMRSVCRTVLFRADTGTLEDSGLYGYFLSRLPEYRRKKTEAFRFERDRRLSLGAWTLLAYVLAERGIDISGLECSAGEHGKPFFPALPHVHFNLSHSGTKVLCAVSGRECGCDVEHIGEARLALAERFFSASEYDLLSRTPQAERPELFCRLWTLKESFLKAAGSGLTLPLNSFSVLPGGAITLFHPCDGVQYGLYEYAFSDGYRYACCLREDGGTCPPDAYSADFRDIFDKGAQL